MVDLRVMAKTSTDQAVIDADRNSGSARVTSAEVVSALVDNEVSNMELRRLLKEANSDPEVRERWKRYQLIRSVLHGELDVDPRVDLSERIGAAIAQEESLQVPGRMKQWRDGLGKTAIAASVALAFVVGFQQVTEPNGAVPGGEGLEPLAGAAQPVADPVAVSGGVPSGFEMPPLAARTVSTGSGSPAQGSASQQSNFYIQALNDAQLQNNQALQQHFNQLLIKHAERSSTSGSMGLLPFARVSGAEAAQE
jgi:sigma-E factor negative regulatory protein RseA